MTHLLYLPSNGAASSWYLDPTPTSAKWRHHNRREISESTPFTSLISFTLEAPKTGEAPPSFWSSPTPKPPWASPTNCSSVSSSSVTPFFQLKKECPLRLSESLLLHIFHLLILAGIEPHPRPMLSLWQSGSPHFSRFFTQGVRPMVPPPLLWDSLSSRLLAGGPVELPTHAPPQSHMQRPPGSQSPLTRSEHVRPSRSGTPSPTSPFPLDPVAPQPRRALLYQSLP